MAFDLVSKVCPSLDAITEQSDAMHGFARAEWVRGREGKVFVRVNRRVLTPSPLELAPVFELANIEVKAHHRGKGVFNAVLAAMEQHAAAQGRAMFIESVLDPHLLRVLPQKGYAMVGEPASSNFYKSHADLVAQYPPPRARVRGPKAR